MSSRKNLSPCGTFAAWLRHKNHGEEPCEACVKAAREFWREKRKKVSQAKRAEKAVKTKKAVQAIQSADGDDPLLVGLQENLTIVKAAMVEAVPREVAALSKRRQELEEAINKHKNVMQAPKTPSLVDELAERRKKRLQKTG